MVTPLIEFKKEDVMVKIIRLFILITALWVPAWAGADTPSQTVEEHVNQLLSVLGNKSLNGQAGEEQKKAAIRAIGDSLFDFYELSRFALGAGWKSLSPEQQKSFVGLYRQLLESIYMGRLLQYKDQKVVFTGESALSDSRSEVRSEIRSADGVIPIDYRLILKDKVWKVYDLVIENASLTMNYRAQFSSILSNNSPDKLLEMLQEKVKEQTTVSK
jgi:phospholipid transport system substrate-binding protein